MAKYIVPSTGAGTFSDDLVGFQLVQGGGLTQGNFEFTTSVTEKVNRTFEIGAFSDPISLESMQIQSLEESRVLLASEYRVFPNYDLSQVTNFTLYGSLSKRLSVSVEKIINYFPGAIEVNMMGLDYTTGATITGITYDSANDETIIDIPTNKIRNPFDIDYTVNSTRDLSLREINVAPIRDFTVNFKNYVVIISGTSYPIIDFAALDSFNSSPLQLVISGNPFNGLTEIFSDVLIKPNDFYTEKAFNENFDEVEKFLLNRLVTPQYTAVFQLPVQTDDGQYYNDNRKITWPLDGNWNLDIRTPAFDNYLVNLSQVGEIMDSLKTNLISRFLTTAAFKEFDTETQKVEKVLQIYGRSFDEVKRFIDALAYVNSVNYNIGNDIPSQLLKNLAQTLGWNINISPITNENFLESVFGNTTQIEFSGFSRPQTPSEVNFQYYRNLIMNSAYLFKSKGTRKSVEFLLRMIGAPEALTDFNEIIYLADSKINMSDFNSRYAKISGGTYSEEIPILDTGTTYTFMGTPYNPFSSTTRVVDVDTFITDYPVDAQGYPKPPRNNELYYFEKGSGWFEQTPAHRSNEQVNLTGSVFTGQSPDVQTSLEPFTYGQTYFERFRNFPYLNLGFNLTKTPDNRKTWLTTDVGLRDSTNANYNAYYRVSDEKLVLNAKNIELFMNVGQGLTYDVWYMSKNYNYPIPNTPYFETLYPKMSVDKTIINPQPQKLTFFEFAQTFWKNMINVRNRQTSTDGKTGGYPTLQSIFFNYLQSEQKVGIPNNNFTYQNMIDYVEGMGDYWIRLIEQMVPASTIWNTGTRYENSIFQRQKMVYRRQRGCVIVPIPCTPCMFEGSLYNYDCTDANLACGIYPWQSVNITSNSFSQTLLNSLQSYLTSIGKTINNCIQNSLQTDWYVDVRLGTNILVQEKFYTGYGINDIPTDLIWKNALNQYLIALNNFGYNYYFEGDTLYISNLGCLVENINDTFYLNVGMNLTISCN